MWVPEEHGAKAAVANYRFAEGRPKPGDRIQVDEGTLVVSRVEEDAPDQREGWGEAPFAGTQDGELRRDVIRITTTKRVKFSYPFATEALAMVVCALGYADVSGELLACAASHGVRMGPGSNFPGVASNEATGKKGKKKRAGASAGAPGGGEQADAGGLFEEAAEVWIRALRDGAKVLERGLGEAQHRSTGKRRRRS